MATTVVGLFDDRGDATAALNDLVANGFGRSDVEEFNRGAVNLTNTLQERGVPHRDAEMFAMGVEQAGDYLLVATTEDSRSDDARDIMNRHGALDINDAHRVRGFTPIAHTQHTSHSVGSAALGAGATGAALGAAHLAHSTPAPSTTAHTHVATSGVNQTLETGDRIAVPVVEEQLVVGKREIQRGGATIHTRVVEKPVTEQVTLREEHVHVERHPVNRAVTNADAAFREAEINVTERAEEAVVGKTARVVEEVVIEKEATQHTETIRDTVRRTDVDIDEVENDTLRTQTRETVRNK